MGGSRRRLKKSRPKVSIKKKRKTHTKSEVPQELSGLRPDLERKLGTKPQWDVQEKITTNYLANGFVTDANASFGRNKRADHLQERADELKESGVEPESDDDLRAAEGKERRDGIKSAPTKPTTHQQQILQRLLDAHGDNLAAMERDRKLNSMLLPAAKLQKLISAYEATKGKGRCGFRAPKKSL